MRARPVVHIAAAALLLSACASQGDAASPTSTGQISTTVVDETTTSVKAETSTTTSANDSEVDLICPPGPSDDVRVDDASLLPDPATDLAANLPEGTDYYKWSTRDGPESDFAPCFHRAADAVFESDWIVIGVVIDGDARAYAPDQLVAHVVNDHIGGTPALVTY